MPMGFHRSNQVQQSINKIVLSGSNHMQESLMTNEAVYRVMMILPQQTFSTLQWMKAELGAASFAEVVRRAIDAYGELLASSAIVEFTGINGLDPGGKGERSERVQVVLSERSKIILDTICKKSEPQCSQSGALRRSLAVMEHLLQQKELIMGKVDDETRALVAM